MASKKRVAYYYDSEMGHYYYAPGHPMKPHRLKLTHHLLLGYGVYRLLNVYRPHLALPEEMTQFHSDDYVDFLKTVTPDNVRSHISSLGRYNVGEQTDCPVFDGLFDFCQLYAGASIDGAVRLNNYDADVCVNWSGGLHHAKKGEASGFCYVNDIVLATLELLKYHARVLYIDIDIHHGDGVEEAFYATDRVMTLSFHKYGDYFPGTGAVKDIGVSKGKFYAMNFPLKNGITDDMFLEEVFKPVINRVMESYRPGAIVLQCGADSLTGDRLGVFNLTLKGHGGCVKYVKSFNVPTLVLGGGGYTIRNVARCWAYETALLLEEDLPNDIPANDYAEYFRPDYRLHLEPAPMNNDNTRKDVEDIRTRLFENLRALDSAPSVQFQSVPPDWAVDRVTSEDPEGKESRDGRRSHEHEYYEDDKDQDKGGEEEQEAKASEGGGGGGSSSMSTTSASAAAAASTSSEATTEAAADSVSVSLGATSLTGSKATAETAQAEKSKSEKAEEASKVEGSSTPQDAAAATEPPSAKAEEGDTTMD